MEDIGHRLWRIGYRRTRPEPECWEVAPIGAPPAMPAVAPPGDPAHSRVLARWRERLKDRKTPSPYQICLAMHIAAAGRRSALS